MGAGLVSRADSNRVRTVIEDAPHVKAADEVQLAIYRAMPPVERLRQALRMNARTRHLMDLGLQAQHPGWTPEQRRREIAKRILYARTG